MIGGDVKTRGVAKWRRSTFVRGLISIERMIRKKRQRASQVRLRAPARIAAAGIAVALTGCGGSGSDSGDAGGNGDDSAPLTGLDARPGNLACVAPSRTDGGSAVALEPAFAGLPPFDSPPLNLLQAPGDDSRWYAAERTGRVRVFENSPDVTSFASVDFLDITVNSSGEGGLLGMAFDPDYATNGRVYLSWTQGSPMQSVVGRFTSTDGGMTLDPAYEEIIRVNQDFSNHNGGRIGFGSDGYLYFGLGDGGSGDDPNNRAQDTTNVLGAMLRLDVSGAGAGYAIPPDNPFAGNAQCPGDHSSATDCPEIYAWGLRNPWRWSFDSATGDLWLGDVGQSAREEIDRIEAGGNYGWDCREGTLSHDSGPSPLCAGADFVEPVYDYDRSQGDVSVTGGYVYRGSALPGLVGSYLFGDYATGRIWRLVDDGQGGYGAEALIDHDSFVMSFAQGNDGELYVLDGGIRRIVADGPVNEGGAAVAAQLSATGCFQPGNPSQPAAGLISWEPLAPAWSDGADKDHWLAIPDGTTMAIGADGDFAFPEGTVLAQHLRLEGVLVETRLLMRHPDGGWAGYSFEWNDAGTDANLLTGGKTAQKGAQDWRFPGSGECMSCHTAAAGFSLGLEVAQLNGDHTYASTGRTHNQLATLDGIGMFASPLGDPGGLPKLTPVSDSAADIESRARSYLHANCSGCHRPDGPTPVTLDFRAATLLENMNACNVVPAGGDLGIVNPLIVAPGEPERSVLPARASVRDATGMPPLASNLVDLDGVAVLEAWIAALDPSCQ